MNILVLGGTRYFGIHMVNKLLENGHNVTIATRGNAKDNFGQSVERIIVDRTNPQQLSNKLQGKYFDVVCDNISYCSNEVKYLLDAVQLEHYVMTSTMSVYQKLHPNINESEFNPLSHELKWCSRDEYTYDETKRQAECALFQAYSHIPSAAVRFPFVIGLDDYTKRLYFYVENIIKGIPMYIDNMNEKIGFIDSYLAGHFLAWIAEQKATGCINGCNSGNISMGEVVRYVEEKTGIKAILSNTAQPAPYNGAPEYTLGTSKAECMGFVFPSLNEYIFKLLDEYIELTK